MKIAKFSAPKFKRIFRGQNCKKVTHPNHTKHPSNLKATTTKDKHIKEKVTNIIEQVIMNSTKFPLRFVIFDNIASNKLIIICIMRRNPYTQRIDRTNYPKGTSKQRNNDINSQSFKLEVNRICEDNYMAPRTPFPYYHPRAVKSLLHRPFTTQKTHSFLEYKRQSYDTNMHRPQLGKELTVSTLRQSRGQKQMGASYEDRLKFQHSKGRLYKGSSWKHDQKTVKEPLSITSRYGNHRKQLSMQEQIELQRKSRRSGGLVDLLGQNLRKGDAKNDQQFFEYIMRFSYRTKKGYIPTNSGKVNQDNFIVNPNINNRTWQHFFAVCDGHGPLGHHVSGFLKNTLATSVSNSKGIERHPKQSLTKAFEVTYQKLLKESGVDLSFSGSTIISCYLNHNRLLCANVGDSRAILGKNKNGSWTAVPLSQDHKPSLEKEAERIKKMKGRVQAFKDQYGEPIGPLRVWVQGDNVPGLAMTRSFGDLVGASVGVSPIPQIKEFTLNEQDRILVIGSDGVFEFLQNEQIIKSLVSFYESKQIQQASDHLLSMAVKSWNKNSSIVDDITFILIFISYNEI